MRGEFYKERKRAARGRVWVLAVNSLFLADLVVSNFLTQREEAWVL
jgi:hypothetical protein